MVLGQDLNQGLGKDKRGKSGVDKNKLKKLGKKYLIYRQILKHIKHSKEYLNLEIKCFYW